MVITFKDRQVIINITKKMVSKWDYLLFNVIFAILWWLFTHGHVIYFWDGGFPLDPITFILRYGNVWNSPGFPGGPNFGFQTYLSFAVMSLPFYLLGMPIGFIQWIITQFLANLSLYGFYKLYTDYIANTDKIILVLIALFYLINYFSINWISEYISNVCMYFLTPILIYYYIKILEIKKFKDYLLYLFLVSLLGMLGLLYEDQTMDLYFLLFITLFALFAKINHNMKVKDIIFKSVIFLSVLILSGIYLSLYVYGTSLGAFKSSFEQFSGNLVIIVGLKYTYSIYNVSNSLMLYLLGIPLKINIIIKYLFGFIYLFIILMPILVKNNTYFIFKNKIIPILIIILIILFGLQSGIFNFVNTTNIKMIEKINIFNILYVGILYAIQYQHIGYPIYFLTSVLFLFIAGINHNRRYALFKSLLLIFLISNFIIYSDIMITHITSNYTVNGISIENIFNDPSWFKNVTDIIGKARYNNVLILPIQDALSETFYYNKTMTSIAVNNPVETNYFLGEILSSVATSPLIRCILNVPSSNVTNFTNYLIILGVKYIILDIAAQPGPGVPARPWTNLPGVYPWNFTSFIRFLNKTPDLKFVGHYGPYYIYKIRSNVPLVYASDGIPVNWSYSQIFWSFASGKIKALNASIIDNISAPLIYNISNVKIWYQIINNDEVKVSIDAYTPFYLILDQGYSNLWQLQINGKIDIYHFKANGYANAWLMPAGNYTAIIIIKTHNLQYTLYIVSILTPTVFSIMLLFYNRRKILELIKTKR
ncbi:hypothetical protein [Saccharolobus caldissimus]|uniref:Uncharacterized protein n=1 Tax=Saccharolobus caldissimus TaxID=1702097 RepID=A0AAQ4CVK6_9CREN|nr:hypothetical protein [Saccharolobus caldissimus]BDB99837.1 hypothetical protein SACC_28540 [Saccharolobus caldissimus]